MKLYRADEFVLLYFVVFETAIKIDCKPLRHSIVASSKEKSTPFTNVTRTSSERLQPESLSENPKGFDNALAITESEQKIVSINDLRLEATTYRHVDENNVDLETKAIFSSNIIKEIARKIEENPSKRRMDAADGKFAQLCNPPLKWTKRGCRHVVSN
jgi:hypothetical protein